MLGSRLPSAPPVRRFLPDRVLPGGVKCLLVSHGTKMGAGAVVVTEHLAATGHTA